jgi:hypothetical protein
MESESRARIFKKSRGLGTEEEEGYRTGPPGYIGWRNSFLGIDSGAPYTFKNTGSATPQQEEGQGGGDGLETKNYRSLIKNVSRLCTV